MRGASILASKRQAARRPTCFGVSSLTVALFLLAEPAAVHAQDAAASAERTAATEDEGGRSSDDQAAGDIVVTAQRRATRLTDVPYNISAVSSEAITASGASNSEDIGKLVVGLGNINQGPMNRANVNNFTLRGLRTDAVGSTQARPDTVNSVSTYYGDSPMFFSVLLKDLERIEVLRGPQGTLYGSGAQGGTIRFLPRRPSFDSFSGEVNVGGSATDHANRLNYNADAVLNLPLTENLALRVVGAYVYQAGFIDQVDLIQVNGDPDPLKQVPVFSIPGDIRSGPVIAPIAEDTNNSKQWMVRAALRFQPTDELDLEVSYLHQRTHADDTQSSNPNYVGMVEDMSRTIPTNPATASQPNASFQTRSGGRLRATNARLQPVTAELDLLSGSATIDLGFADLTSISSYFKSRTKSWNEQTGSYILATFNYLNVYRLYPRFTAPAPHDIDHKGFTQEFRLVSKGDTPLSYVLGAYYEKQKSHDNFVVYSPGIYAFADAIGQPGANPQLLDLLFVNDRRSKSSNIAAFGELTYHITPKWDVTGGARVFRDKLRASRTNQGPFIGQPYGDQQSEPLALGTVYGENSQSVTDYVFKVNTAYKFTPDTMLYATFSQGFRRGGTNPLPTTGFLASLPDFLEFKPDFADNYEVGLKGIALDRKLTYSVSAFSIDLKNFQFNQATPAGLGAVYNGKKARSRGIEAEFTVRPAHGLSLSAGYAYTDAKVKDGLMIFDYGPGGFLSDPKVIVRGASVVGGLRLPGVSKHSILGAVDYTQELADGSSISFHANANYRSNQHNQIAVVSGNFAVIPSAFMADTRITYDSGKSWTASLFVNNITDEIGYAGANGVQNVGGVTVPFRSARLPVSQPRTAGVALNYAF